MNQYSFAQYQFDNISLNGVLAKYGVQPELYKEYIQGELPLESVCESLLNRGNNREVLSKLYDTSIKEVFLLCVPHQNISQDLPEKKIVKNLDRLTNLNKFTVEPDEQPAESKNPICIEEGCVLIIIWLTLFQKTANFRYLSNAFKCADLLQPYAEEHLVQRVLSGLVTIFWGCFENS